jgi:hypothetical protein
MHLGETRGHQRDRVVGSRAALGVMPTISVNRELNEPSDVDPTAIHAEVTVSPARSRAMARGYTRARTASSPLSAR